MWVVLGDLGALAGTLAATAACVRAYRRSTGADRRAWGWLTAAAAAWALGVSVRLQHALASGGEVPAPSVADAAFLVFPVASAMALVHWLREHRGSRLGWCVDVLDSLIAADSLLVLAWLTLLGRAVDGGPGGAATVVPVVHSTGDLVVVALAFLAVARAGPGRRGVFALLVVTLVAVTGAHGAYAAAAARDDSTGSGWPGVGWAVGFTCLAWAAVRAASREPAQHAGPPGERVTEDDSPPRGVRLALPWVPLLMAVPATGITILTAPTLPVEALVLALLALPLVVVRQVLAGMETHRLFVALQEARDTLEYRSLHDPLTGLPNRALFRDRLRQAFLQPAGGLTLLFCDLDDFKQVNDLHGHETGDAVLCAVAERLLESLRETDTVARLGGDEFSILLVGDSDAALVVDRIVTRVAEPIQVGARSIRVSMSVGVARRSTGRAPEVERRGLGASGGQDASLGPFPDEDWGADAQSLIARGDAAMYAAKGAGKGRAVVQEPEDGDLSR